MGDCILNTRCKQIDKTIFPPIRDTSRREKVSRIFPLLFFYDHMEIVLSSLVEMSYLFFHSTRRITISEVTYIFYLLSKG